MPIPIDAEAIEEEEEEEEQELINRQLVDIPEPSARGAKGGRDRVCPSGR